MGMELIWYKLLYYYSNKQSHYERNKRTEAKIKEFYENYKATHPCIVCGESAPECIDFHHLRDKVDVLAHMVKGGSLWHGFKSHLTPQYTGISPLSYTQ